MTLSGKIYRCRAGETFDSVALKIYGHEKYAPELLCANPIYCTIPVFAGGELLKLPVVYIPEKRRNSGGYKPVKAPWKE